MVTGGHFRFLYETFILNCPLCGLLWAGVCAAWLTWHIGLHCYCRVASQLSSSSPSYPLESLGINNILTLLIIHPFFVVVFRGDYLRMYFCYLGKSSCGCLTGRKDNSGVIIDFLVWSLCYGALWQNPAAAGRLSSCLMSADCCLCVREGSSAHDGPVQEGFSGDPVQFGPGEEAGSEEYRVFILSVNKCAKRFLKKYSCKENNITSSNIIPVSLAQTLFSPLWPLKIHRHPPQIHYSHHVASLIFRNAPIL